MTGTPPYAAAVGSTSTPAGLWPDLALLGVAPGGGARRLLDALGLVTVASGSFDADAARRLFGLAAPSAWQLLGVPGCRSGRVLAVATPHPPRPRRALQAGAVALDVFTTRLAEVVAVAERAGARAAGHAEYLREDGKQFAMTRLVTADGLSLVAIQPASPRPSRLDLTPELLVSEVTATLVMVADVAAAVHTWTAGTGLAVVLEYTRGEQQVGRLMELPRPATPHHMVLLAPLREPTFRFELVGLPDEVVQAPDERPAPLCQGMIVTGFSAADPRTAAYHLDARAAVADTTLGRLGAGIAADRTPFLVHGTHGEEA